MTLLERIAQCEKIGLRFRGFFVAPDVYDKLRRSAKTVDEEVDAVSRMVGFHHLGAVRIQVSVYLSRGCVTPLFESVPSGLTWLGSSQRGEKGAART